jgi:hypothetical protein
MSQSVVLLVSSVSAGMHCDYFDYRNALINALIKIYIYRSDSRNKSEKSRGYIERK